MDSLQWLRGAPGCWMTVDSRWEVWHLGRYKYKLIDNRQPVWNGVFQTLAEAKSVAEMRHQQTRG